MNIRKFVVNVKQITDNITLKDNIYFLLSVSFSSLLQMHRFVQAGFTFISVKDVKRTEAFLYGL